MLGRGPVGRTGQTSLSRFIHGQLLAVDEFVFEIVEKRLV